jgi:2-hydroxy-6-oxonona-2,4-dienedioate hydrolase
MTKLKGWLLIAGVALIALTGSVTVAYLDDMARAYARIEGRSQVIDSPVGRIEYTTQGGAAPAVLVIHGSGGGFDQGELLARAALGDGLRRVIPSRFGYLRSTFRPGATFDDQAHAYAHLLDHLGIERVAVVAFSHGGPSALLFAALYPQRVSSLTLLSAGVASSNAPAQQQADAQGAMLMKIFQHDFVYWAITKAFRTRFLALMGVSDEVTARLTPAQRQLADELIDGMNPVSPRAAGAAFDHQAAMPNERIAAIRAPTLIIHARDDSLQRFENAEFAARTIRGSRLEAFDRGGHLLLAVEQMRLAQLVAEHLRGSERVLPAFSDGAARTSVSPPRSPPGTPARSSPAWRPSVR